MLGLRLLALSLLFDFGCPSPARPVPVRAEPAVEEPAIEVLMQTANASVRAGNLDGASATIEQVLSRDATNAAARRMLVEILIKKARWADAEAQAALLAKQHPDETQPLYLQAVIALRRGDARRAADLARNCIQ